MILRAVSWGAMPAVEVGIGIEVVSYFYSSLFEVREHTTVGRQFRFQRIPVGISLGVIIKISRPAKAGHDLCLGDAVTARGAGILTAAVGVDNKD